MALKLRFLAIKSTITSNETCYNWAFFKLPSDQTILQDRRIRKGSDEEHNFWPVEELRQRKLVMVPSAWLLCDEDGKSQLHLEKKKDRDTNSRLILGKHRNQVSAVHAFFTVVYLPQDAYDLWKKYVTYKLHCAVYGLLKKKFVNKSEGFEEDVLQNILTSGEGGDDGLCVLRAQSEYMVSINAKYGSNSVEYIAPFQYNDIMAVLSSRVPKDFKGSFLHATAEVFQQIADDAQYDQENPKIKLFDRPILALSRCASERVVCYFFATALVQHLQDCTNNACGSENDSALTTFDSLNEMGMKGWLDFFKRGLPQRTDFLYPSETSEDDAAAFMNTCIEHVATGKFTREFKPGRHPAGLLGNCKVKLDISKYSVDDLVNDLKKIKQSPRLVLYNIVMNKMNEMQAQRSIAIGGVESKVMHVQLLQPVKKENISGASPSFS